MQAKWDYIDEMIKSAVDDTRVSQNYNEILMQKLVGLNETNLRERHMPLIGSIFDKKRIAVSLILSGVLLFIFSTTSIQYKVIDFNRKIRNEALMVQYEYNYKFNFNKNIFGEW